MESFNANLQGGKKLVKSLEKQSVRPTQPRVPPSPASTGTEPAPAPASPRPRLPQLASAPTLIDPCAQPVSCLQAPATPAIVASGYEDGGAAIAVGTNAATHQRVIVPVSSA